MYERMMPVSGCEHQLVFQPAKGGFKFRCLKCWSQLKNRSGVELTPDEAKIWFNEHGQVWPWNQPAPSGN